MEKRSLPDPEDLRSGTWLVALVPSPRSFIGRVFELDGERENEPNVVPPKQFSRHEILKARVLTLYPVFDFFNTTLRPVPVRGPDGKPAIDQRTGMPEMGMARDPLVNPLDFTYYPTPLDLFTDRLIGVYHLSQMHQFDAEQYRDFMKQAVESQKRYRQAHSKILSPTEAEREALARGHGRA